MDIIEIFKNTGSTVHNIVEEMRDHTKNIDTEILKIGENWKDAEGQKFISVWVDVKDGNNSEPGLNDLYNTVDAVGLFMDVAYKKYTEFKAANAKSVNTNQVA